MQGGSVAARGRRCVWLAAMHASVNMLVRAPVLCFCAGEHRRSRHVKQEVGAEEREEREAGG